MPCIPAVSLLTSTVGGVLPLFYVGTERESSPGETAPLLFSARMRLMYDFHVAHLGYLVSPYEPLYTWQTKT
jgi:hypothetical protein